MEYGEDRGEGVGSDDQPNHPGYRGLQWWMPLGTEYAEGRVVGEGSGGQRSRHGSRDSVGRDCR